MFFRDTVLDLFLTHFIRFYIKNGILGPLQNPVRVKMAPQIRPVTPKPVLQIEAGDHCWRSWKRLVPQRPPNHPKSPQGAHFECHLIDFGPPQASVSMILGTILVSFLHSAEPSSTKLNEKYLQRTNKTLAGNW